LFPLLLLLLYQLHHHCLLLLLLLPHCCWPLQQLLLLKLLVAPDPYFLPTTSRECLSKHYHISRNKQSLLIIGQKLVGGRQLQILI
jgi:hypothetical protein